MRLVRISDLSEEERKKALEEQQARQEANRQASEQARQNANERFNELVSKRGEYDTFKHTTTINRLKKAYKGKSSYETVNNSLNSYYQRNKNQNNSMWNQIQNRAEENNRFTNNSRLMLYNNQNKSEGNILDNLRNWVFGNSVASNREKRNNIQEKEEKENKTILGTELSKEKQTNKLTTFAEQDKILAPIKKEADIQEKNDDIWQDIAGVANLAGLGISSGSKEVLNYIENANENNFNNYENIKKQQFLTSPNVSEEDKAVAKSQDNLLLQKNGINVEQKIETNLVKKAIRDSINKDEEKISDITSKISNKGMQKLADIAPSMGQMLPGTLLNAVNPILGTSYFMTSSGGSYIEDAKKRGMNDEQAFKYGTIMGILEGASESFITGQQVNKVSKALMGKEVSKDILNSYGFNMFENAIQEAVMEPAQEMTAGIVGGKDKADWSNIGTRMAESGFNGALMGAITNGVTYGLEKSIKVYNKIKNKENVTPKEYKEALQENIDRFGNKAVEQGIRQGATETYQEINRINNSRNQSNLQSININQQQNQNNIDTTNMSFEDSAKAYNLDTNNETIRAVNKALSNRDIAGRFDANIFSNSNENAIWRTYADEKGNTKREVIFNPNGNSQATIQQISIHELTHDLAGTKEFDELKNLVLDRNKEMQGYAEARQSLENTYSQVYDPNSKDFKSLVDDEEVADTLAQKLGDQEFVNSLSTEKPTVFKRIYDWVVDKVNKITGNKIEKVYWEDIRNKFENAYRQTYQGESNQTRYSFVGQKGLKNAIYQDSSYVQIERGLNRAKQMSEKGIDNEEIRQTTGWFQDKNKDWKFEITDKNMKLRNDVNIKKNKTYKLSDIIEHDTLFTMYPEFKDIDIKFEDLKNINGFYDRKEKTITLNNQIANSNTKMEKTIIHELQHSIQKEEGFENGTSSRPSKKRYYENLGEIEATDVTQRFIEEKYKNIDVDYMAPESSKANPKHKNYDRYMKKRGVVDKIKDSMFKSNKKGDKSHEAFEENISKNKTPNNDMVVGRERGRYLNETNQESLEQTNKETLRDNDKQIWNGLNRLPKDRNFNIKHSTKSEGAWQEFLDNQIGQRGKGKTVQELKLPTKETINNKKANSYNVLYQSNTQESIKKLPISEGGKVRKHYKSIMQSPNTAPEAKAIAKELMGTDTYVPDSNERQLKVADDRIEKNGADNEAVTLATKVKNGDKITAEDIATGERLIEYYSKIGDKEKLQDSIQNVALAGTQAGQTVQAMSLINRQTPQGQAVYLSKVIDRMNNEIDKRTKGKGKKFELTADMLEKITTSSKENLETNIDEVARELANQVPKTTIEKIDSWRYFSMLANPRTHFRNIIGNFSMAGVQSVKNKVAGGLEIIAQKTGMIDKRTKTLKPASKETREFAKSDVENVMARLNNESKFDTKNLIQQYQRTFKSNLLENTLGKLYNLNSKALEAEDVFGLKRGYRKALADYMTANKLTKADLTAGTREADIQLEKARKYAIEQAQEATFHQQSAMASILSTFEKKNTATRLITGAVIPFKKTPINVAKTGASYSPLGLVKSFTLDVANLRNGKITANQYIDNLAKGLTGTGITAVGYALAQAGILSASGDDDDQKNQYYQEDRGNQPFSIKIGDKTYSLDWLAPTAIPLFVGAELNYNVNNTNEEQATEDVLDRISNGIDAMSSAMNPMIEMSMLSGVASTIKGFSQGDTQVFQNLAINAGKSYINQFFPTLSGQIAKIVDETERSTTSTKKNAFAKAVDSTGKQILNKIPFLSTMLPAKTDVWGNTLKRDSNPLYRGLQQMAFPWTEKKLKSTDVDNAISDLYEETGEKSVLPNTSINKDFTLNGEKYRLTPEEYAEYKKQYGKNSYNLLNELTNSKEYKNMNNEQKAEAISKIYEYANEKNKVEYANKKKINIETSSLYNAVTSIEEEGGKGSDYFKYLGQITGIEKADDKIKILSKADIPSNSKSSIYVNTVGKSDDLYTDVLQPSNINIDEYLKYKQQKFESDKEDDGTLEGKTVTNSKKKKVYSYVNNMNITYNQKLLILGKQYKLSDNEQRKLYEYINNMPSQTSQEKLEIFKKYSNNFEIYKNGTMSFK